MIATAIGDSDCKNKNVNDVVYGVVSKVSSSGIVMLVSNKAS